MDDTISPDRFYVYMLYRDNIPFYVGKGSNGRIDAHEMCACNRSTCRHLTCRVIRKVWREGKQITKNKVCEDVTEITAFKIEKLMITIGLASGWPLVNLTSGGEGASGYRWTPEQRQERSIRAKQDVASIERLRIANTGRKHTDKEIEKRRIRVKEAWSDPVLREKKSAQSKQMWRTPAIREKQRQALMRPEIYAELGKHAIGKAPANTKTYPGFVSPDGTVYEHVFNLHQFAREHGLRQSNLQAVASGKDYSYKGWRRYPLREKKPTKAYSGPGFVAPDGTVYPNISSLTDFCNEHDLSMKCMSNVSRGKSHSHKGWTRYNP